MTLAQRGLLCCKIRLDTYIERFGRSRWVLELSLHCKILVCIESSVALQLLIVFAKIAVFAQANIIADVWLKPLSVLKKAEQKLASELLICHDRLTAPVLLDHKVLFPRKNC